MAEDLCIARPYCQLMSILVAIADDELRTHVLGAAITLGKALDDELYVVHVTDEEGATVDTRNLADEIRNELVGRGVEFSVAIEYVESPTRRSGTAVGQRLASIADDEEITHAVVGHQAKDRIERLLGGDVAFSVAEAASVPVTIVPEDSGLELTPHDSEW